MLSYLSVGGGGVVEGSGGAQGKRGKLEESVRFSAGALRNPKGMPYSEATWLSSKLVLNTVRLETEVPSVAGAASAMMLHWRQQSSKVRNVSITFCTECLSSNKPHTDVV